MKKLKFLIVVIFFLIGTSHSFAQYFGFNDLYYSPVSPIETDTIGVVCDSYHGSGTCFLVNSNVNQNGFTITIDALHIPGPWTAICETIDTIMIGPLDPGSYTIIYNLIDSMSNGSHMKIDTLYLNIISNNINQGIEEEKEVVFQNPVENKLNLNVRSKDLKAANLYDFRGKVVLCISDDNLYDSIDVSHLVNGMYIMELIFNDRKIFEKLIINHNKH